MFFVAESCEFSNWQKAATRQEPHPALKICTRARGPHSVPVQVSCMPVQWSVGVASLHKPAAAASALVVSRDVSVAVETRDADRVPDTCRFPRTETTSWDLFHVSRQPRSFAPCVLLSHVKHQELVKRQVSCSRPRSLRLTGQNNQLSAKRNARSDVHVKCTLRGNVQPRSLAQRCSAELEPQAQSGN